MASVSKRTGKNGEVHWYAVIYNEGGGYHWERLLEKAGDKHSNPLGQKRAQELANQAERRYHKIPAAKRTVSRHTVFSTAWQEFNRDYISTKAENTRNDYHYTWGAHLSKAPFHRKRVHNITIDDIRDYVELKLKTLDPHTVNNQTSMLAKFFLWAREHNYFDGDVNPAKAMGVRQTIHRKPLVFIDADQARLLIKSFDPKVDEKYAVLTATLLWTGIRWSEARSLTWDSVHLNNSHHYHLSIRTTAVGMTIQDHPKTGAGNRSVAIPPTLAKMLKKWNSNKKIGGTLGVEMTRLGISSPLVFPSDAGTLLGPDNYRKRQFTEAKKRAHAKDPSFPLTLTVHGLRHSYATNLLVQGASVFSLKSEMGHASIQSSMAYTHYQPELGNPITAGMVENSIKKAKRTPAAATSASKTAATPVHKGIPRKSPKKATTAAQSPTPAPKPSRKLPSKKSSKTP